MKFTKMHGAGNDFLLVQGYEDRDWPALSQAMCERHLGAGADGVILVLPSAKAAVRMRLFNADGSEAEVSGNGVRCLVKYVVERGLAMPADGKVTIEAIHAVLVAGVEMDGQRVRSVRLSMGPPRFEPREVPVAAEMSPPVIDLPIEVDGERLPVTCLSMGNPHAVTFIDTPVTAYPLETIGPKVEHHAAFPARVNFGVGRLLSRDHMELRVWERGCGETLACGSGSCAAMVAARLKGLAGDAVDITQPGGQLRVEWDGIADVFLSGDARFVFDGDWPD
ncbi:MAG TPA: diaminopimelate epimerase [Dehalococcoidia bacterium]|nr:diaminopimelate epimerase [Dehalococcoidia bacterium]